MILKEKLTRIFQLTYKTFQILILKHQHISTKDYEMQKIFFETKENI